MQTECPQGANWDADEYEGKGGRNLSFWGRLGMGVCKQSLGNATTTPAKWQCDLDAFRPSESDTVTRRLAALERIAK